MEKYKKNALSLIPGGHDITFVYLDGQSTKHCNIKNVRAYRKKMEAVKGSEIIDVIYTNGPAKPEVMQSGHNLQAAIGRVTRKSSNNIEITDLSALTKSKEDRMQFHPF